MTGVSTPGTWDAMAAQADPALTTDSTPGEQLDSPEVSRRGCHGNAVMCEGARSPPDGAIFPCPVPSGTPRRPSRSSQRPTSLFPSRLQTHKEQRVRGATGAQRLQAQPLAESRGSRDIARPGAPCLPPLLTLFRGAAARHFLPTGPAARALYPVPAADRSCLSAGSGLWRPRPRWRRPARRGSGCLKRRT